MSLTDKEVSELTGEDSIKKPKYVLPFVRLEGKKGVFMRYNPETSSEEELPEKTITGVMIKHRRTYSAFEEESSMFTNEHNSWKEKVTLFQRKKKVDGKFKIEMIEEGIAKDIKGKYQNLQMTQIIYFLVGNDIVKLKVKGKGLSNLFEFFKVFEAREHMWQYLIEIGIGEFENKLGKYYAMSFARKEMVDNKEEVIQKIQEVSENIENAEKYYADKEKERTDSVDSVESVEYGEDAGGIGGDSEKHIPIIDEDEDDIDVTQIPF